jgi:hypothetical protein
MGILPSDCALPIHRICLESGYHCLDSSEITGNHSTKGPKRGIE